MPNVLSRMCFLLALYFLACLWKPLSPLARVLLLPLCCYLNPSTLYSHFPLWTPGQLQVSGTFSMVPCWMPGKGGPRELSSSSIFVFSNLPLTEKTTVLHLELVEKLPTLRFGLFLENGLQNHRTSLPIWLPMNFKIHLVHWVTCENSKINPKNPERQQTI